MRGLTYDKVRDQYRIQFRSRHTRPRQNYKERLPKGTSKRQAEEYLVKLKEDDRMMRLVWPGERDSANELPPTTPSVGEFATDVYMPDMETVNAAQTLRAKRQALAATSPWFWDVPMDEINLELVLRYRRERLEEGVSNRTVNMQWETVRHLLSHAHKLGKIDRPPPIVDPLPTTRRHRKPFRYLTEQEAQQALENAADKGAMWYALTLFLLSTGARWGEARALLWHHVDFDRREIYLDASSAKHGESRIIPMLPELADALQALPRCPHDNRVWMRRHYKTGEWIRLKANAKAIGGKYVWQGEGDKEVDVSPHVFRHTFATWRLQRGESAKVVSVYLGHSTTKMTTDTYGHVIPTDRPEAIANAPRPQVRRLRVVGEE